MDSGDDFVQPIGKSWPVRKVGPLRLHKRRMYKPKLKAGFFVSPDKDDEVETSESGNNQAHGSPEGVGERIDFKV